MAGGRPRLYTSEEEVHDIIEEYFATLSDDEVPTMSGLALALGMCTETLRQYGKQEQFSATIKKARQRVELGWEKLLMRGGAGPIFWLKNNAGWKDKSELDTNNNNNNVSKIEYVIRND
jgi:hypothetical protein